LTENAGRETDGSPESHEVKMQVMIMMDLTAKRENARCDNDR